MGLSRDCAPPRQTTQHYDDEERGTTMSDVPNPIEIQKHLSGVDYPVTRDELVSTAEDEGADDPVLDALRRLPEGEYDSPTAVSSAVSDLG
jgi:hypothetical protein